MYQLTVEILTNQFGVEEESLNRDTNIREDLGADSLDIFEIVSAFEAALGYKIPISDIAGLKTIGQIEDYLNSKQ